MSPGRAAGDSAGDLPQQWIGTAQRESAAWALDEHFTANRLTLGEYTDRSECVVQATLASELSALFVDLPHHTPCSRTRRHRNWTRHRRAHGGRGGRHAADEACDENRARILNRPTSPDPLATLAQRVGTQLARS